MLRVASVTAEISRTLAQLPAINGMDANVASQIGEAMAGLFQKFAASVANASAAPRPPLAPPQHAPASAQNTQTTHSAGVEILQSGSPLVKESNADMAVKDKRDRDIGLKRKERERDGHLHSYYYPLRGWGDDHLLP